MRRCRSSGWGRAVVFAEIKCHHRKRRCEETQVWAGLGGEEDEEFSLDNKFGKGFWSGVRGPGTVPHGRHSVHLFRSVHFGGESSCSLTVCKRLR